MPRWGNLAHLKEIETEGLDLSEDAVKPGLIQHAGQDRLRALPLPGHGRKRGKQRGADMAVDPDQVPGGCGTHAAMVRLSQVSPHRQDLVTSGPEWRNALTDVGQVVA